MTSSPHDLALFALTGGAAVAALLLADAADEARHQIAELNRCRARRFAPMNWVLVWARPAAFHIGSLAFLGGMATSGALLIGAFP